MKTHGEQIQCECLDKIFDIQIDTLGNTHSRCVQPLCMLSAEWGEWSLINGHM